MRHRHRDEDGMSLLLIDRAAAAEIPSDESVREWARDKRGFISSVMSELSTERSAAAEAVRRVGARAVLFEEFGARDADSEDAYLGELETCAIYLGILGRRYGHPLRTRFSATHTEYRHAEECGLRIAVWTTGSNDREGPQQSFLDEVRTFHVVPEYESAGDLSRQIEERLRSIAAEDLAPWVKLGNLVFRAQEVALGSGQIRVTARVQSDEVAHALEGLAPGKYGRGDTLRFSWAGRSRYVNVDKVEATTTTARSKWVSLDLEIVDSPRDQLLEMSVNGMTPDDLTDVALRSSLFGETNPLAKQHLGFVAEIPDPFAALRTTKVPDEIVRPLAELMLVDALMGSGRGARIHHFRLGTSISGDRQLQFSWDPRKRYANGKPTRRSLAGRVRL
jgi:hypothetical protein